MTKPGVHPISEVDMGRSNGSKNVRADKKTKISEMYKAGLTQTGIAHYVKMSQDTVKSIIKRGQQYSTNSITKKNGRKPKLLSEQHNNLLNYIYLNKKELLC